MSNRCVMDNWLKRWSDNARLAFLTHLAIAVPELFVPFRDGLLDGSSFQHRRSAGQQAFSMLHLREESPVVLPAKPLPAACIREVRSPLFKSWEGPATQNKVGKGEGNLTRSPGSAGSLVWWLCPRTSHSSLLSAGICPN